MTSYMEQITDSKLETVKRDTVDRISRYRRAAEAARAIAKELDGAYVTKKIEPKILAAVPGAKRVYLSQVSYSSNVSVVISYSLQYCRDTQDDIILCSKESRRLDGSKLIQYAKGEELNAMEYENKLARIDGAVKRYNELAREYAKLYLELNIEPLANNIPWPDYNIKQELENGVTPEKFLETLTA